MKKFKTVFVFFTALFVFGLMSVNAFAQDISGRWEGTFVWAGNAGVKNESYDWDEGKWVGTTRKPIKLVLELEKTDEEDKYKGKYIYGDYGSDQMHFEATFADSLMKGGTVGSAIKGKAQWGGYMELTLREADGKRYLEGSWRTSERAKNWEGRVALRFEDGN